MYVGLITRARRLGGSQDLRPLCHISADSALIVVQWSKVPPGCQQADNQTLDNQARHTTTGPYS